MLKDLKDAGIAYYELPTDKFDTNEEGVREQNLTLQVCDSCGGSSEDWD